MAEPNAVRAGSLPRWLAPLLTLALGVGVGGFLLYWFVIRPDNQGAGKDDPKGKQTRATGALGRVEPADGVITMTVPLPDRLAGIDVKVGQGVKKNDKLGVLDSRAEREKDLELARQQRLDAAKRYEAVEKAGNAQVEVERLRVEQLKAEKSPEIVAQEIKVAQLELQVPALEKNWERLTGLKNAPVSQQEREQQFLQLQQARKELEGARALLSQLGETKGLNLKAAEAQLEATKQTLKRTLQEIPLETLRLQEEMAEMRYRRTEVLAPCDGKVLKVLAHPGELVGPAQPLLQLADTRRMVVLAEVYETDLAKVRVGQAAHVRSRTYAQPLRGTVEVIGGMIAKNRIYDVDPTADVDRRVFEVRVQLDEEASKQVAGLIHQQVQVEFLDE